MYRVYLRDPQQRVSDKTNTGDRAAAIAAFSSLVSRTALDGTQMLAVLNCDGRPVAHHDFRLRADGSPHDPSKYWRGKIDAIPWPATARSPVVHCDEAQSAMNPIGCMADSALSMLADKDLFVRHPIGNVLVSKSNTYGTYNIVCVAHINIGLYDGSEHFGDWWMKYHPGEFFGSHEFPETDDPQSPLMALYLPMRRVNKDWAITNRECKYCRDMRQNGSRPGGNLPIGITDSKFQKWLLKASCICVSYLSLSATAYPYSVFPDHPARCA